MIRIDEIYNNTFGSYVSRHIPATKMYFCEPFGHTQPENLCSIGNEEWYSNYIVFHDQEPIISDVHKPLFDRVVEHSTSLQHGLGGKHRAVVVSEQKSRAVEQVCQQYNWQPYYYFFHGWAALDWYRGYNHSFVIEPVHKRKIKHSFISPNRIIGGQRDHRLLLMYNILKRNASQNAVISFPKTCPVEQVNVSTIAEKFKSQYSDIQSVFSQVNLPLNFPNEIGHPMHSCWLSLFDQVENTMAYVVTETVFTGERLHLTEKVFKPICQQIPFVLVSTQGSLEYLRSYGFHTFGDIWDESYDQEADDYKRIEMIADLLQSFDNMSTQQLQETYEAAIPVIEHNYNHFYNGGFEQILWQELMTMLESIKRDFALW